MCYRFRIISGMRSSFRLVKEKGLAPVFLDSRLEHPAGWICARYNSSVLLLLFCIIDTVFVAIQGCQFIMRFSKRHDLTL